MSVFNVLLLSLTELFGDTQFKFYARSGLAKNLLAGLAGYVGVIFFLIRSLTQGNVMWVNGMWDGVSGIVNTAFAFMILGERMNHTYQYFGLGLIGLGLMIMHRGGIAY